MKGEKSWSMVLQVIRIRGSFEFSITVAQCLNENGHPHFSPSFPPFFLGTSLRLICSLHNPHTTDPTQQSDELTQICKIIKH